MEALPKIQKRVRVWKIGSLDPKMIPTPQAFMKLRALIEEAQKAEGYVDIMWGPDLQIIEIPGDIMDEITQEVVTAEEFTQALIYIRKQKEGTAHESN